MTSITDQRIREIYELCLVHGTKIYGLEVGIIIERLLMVDRAFDDELIGSLREVGGMESFDLVKETCLEEAEIKLRTEGMIRGNK